MRASYSVYKQQNPRLASAKDALNGGQPLAVYPIDHLITTSLLMDFVCVVLLPEGR